MLKPVHMAGREYVPFRADLHLMRLSEQEKRMLAERERFILSSFRDEDARLEAERRAEADWRAHYGEVVEYRPSPSPESRVQRRMERIGTVLGFGLVFLVALPIFVQVGIVWGLAGILRLAMLSLGMLVFYIAIFRGAKQEP